MKKYTMDIKFKFIISVVQNVIYYTILYYYILKALSMFTMALKPAFIILWPHAYTKTKQSKHRGP
jgi:hypothetical protein